LSFRRTMSSEELYVWRMSAVVIHSKEHLNRA
jgi:hypothetical protein